MPIVSEDSFRPLNFIVLGALISTLLLEKCEAVFPYLVLRLLWGEVAGLFGKTVCFG